MLTAGFILRAFLSGVLVVVIAAIAKKSPGVGGMVAALPLTSLTAAMLLWQETGDADGVATFMSSTIGYVLLSLPMFLLTPLMLRGGCNFWLSLGAGIGLTFALYLAANFVGPRFGITL